MNKSRHLADFCKWWYSRSSSKLPRRINMSCLLSRTDAEFHNAQYKKDNDEVFHAATHRGHCF